MAQERLPHPGDNLVDISSPDIAFGSMRGAVLYTANQIVLNGGLNKMPPVSDKPAFTRFMGEVSENYIRKHYLPHLNVKLREILDRARCQVRGVAYISREDYHACDDLDTLYNLLIQRIHELGNQYEPYLPNLHHHTMSRKFGNNFDFHLVELGKLIKTKGWKKDNPKLTPLKIWRQAQSRAGLPPSFFLKKLPKALNRPQNFHWSDKDHRV